MTTGISQNNLNQAKQIPDLCSIFKHFEQSFFFFSYTILENSCFLFSLKFFTFELVCGHSLILGMGWRDDVMMEWWNECWKWLEISGNGWKCRNGWKCLEMTGNGWKWLNWLKMAENDCQWLKWLEIAGNGWKLLDWLEMAGNGWKWLKTRRGSPIDCRHSTAEAPPIGKIHPFSKIAIWMP